MLLSRFREQLQSSEWAERERVPRTAGLAILQAIAVRVDSKVAPDASDIDMARAVVDTLPQSATSRALGELLRVIDAEPPSPAGPALMEYGETLEDDAAYELAADVYQLAAELGRREQGLCIAPAALNRVGTCLRSLARYAEAKKAYRGAIAVAQELSDPVAELLSYIGLAKLEVARGNRDTACQQLDNVIDVARVRDVPFALALGLHERGLLASQAGDLETALLTLTESLGIQHHREAQARVLTDVGGVLQRLGLIDAAREVFACVRVESTRLDLKWSATINLLDVAGVQSQWVEFDHLRRVLEASPLTPLRRCEFLLTLAEGLDRRGDNEARAIYRALLATATKSALKEFQHIAQQALGGAHVSQTTPLQVRPLSERCRPAINVIHERCVAAGTQSN